MKLFLRALLTLLGWLPLPLLHGIGWAVGMLLWWLPNKQRVMTQRQLELCLPNISDAERRHLGRRSLIESMKAVAEAPAIWFGPSWRLKRWLNDSGARQQLVDAGRERGLILLTPHLGAWELAGQFAVSCGPTTILYKPQDEPFDSLIQSGRSRLPGAKLATTSAAGVRSLMQGLRNKETVGILPDHDPPEGSGRFADFFDIPAHTMDLVSKLAARSGAEVWFIAALRLSWGRGFRYFLLPANEQIADAENGPAALNQGVETCVLKAPDQYWWAYRRYRRRPPGSADLYNF